MKKIFLMLALATPICSYATVSGTFLCQGKVSSVVKANGRTVRQTSYSSSMMTFNADGTVTSTTPISPYVSHGSWSQRGRSILVVPDINDMARDALYGCSLSGARCTFVGATARSKATSNKGDSVIRGSSKINLTMLVNGILANNNATSTFTCNQ